jgi:hypothetical protein
MISCSQLLLDMIGKILQRGIASADGMIRAALPDQSETIGLTYLGNVKVLTVKTFFDCEACNSNPIPILKFGGPNILISLKIKITDRAYLRCSPMGTFAILSFFVISPINK